MFLPERYSKSEKSQICFCVLLSFGVVLVDVVSNSLRSPGLHIACQALQSKEFSRQEYWSHFLLQGIFWTQGSNPRLLQCKQILYLLSHRGSRRLKYFMEFKCSMKLYPGNKSPQHSVISVLPFPPLPCSSSCTSEFIY